MGGRARPGVGIAGGWRRRRAGARHLRGREDGRALARTQVRAAVGLRPDRAEARAAPHCGSAATLTRRAREERRGARRA
eukprot:3018672-Prymnesium_polylepis.1